VELTYRPASSIEDSLAFERLVVTCFAFPPEHVSQWMKRIGLANVRLLSDGRSTPAGLAIIPMGQWFGGRSVTCAGIAAVAVAPEARNRGLGRRVMESVVRELAASDSALSCLYPATLPLYRSVGYELAGGRYESRVAALALPNSKSTLEIVPLAAIDDAAMRACYSEAAALGNGSLDRGRAMWERVRENRNEVRDGYAVVDRDGRVRAYAWFVRQRTASGLAHDLLTSDLCVADREGALALAGFFHRHRSMVHDVVWNGGAHDPFRDSLPEIGVTTQLASPWMTRIIDVVRAFEQRGFAPALTARLELEIEDPLCADNHGRFVLEVEEGTARVSRGGAGRVVVPITDLAAIYTGYASAETRARFGGVRGEARELALFSSLFAGAAPAMPDMF